MKANRMTRPSLTTVHRRRRGYRPQQRTGLLEYQIRRESAVVSAHGRQHAGARVRFDRVQRVVGRLRPRRSAAVGRERPSGGCGRDGVADGPAEVDRREAASDRFHFAAAETRITDGHDDGTFTEADD